MLAVWLLHEDQILNRLDRMNGDPTTKGTKLSWLSTCRVDANVLSFLEQSGNDGTHRRKQRWSRNFMLKIIAHLRQPCKLTINLALFLWWIVGSPFIWSRRLRIWSSCNIQTASIGCTNAWLLCLAMLEFTSLGAKKASSLSSSGLHRRGLASTGFICLDCSPPKPLQRHSAWPHDYQTKKWYLGCITIWQSITSWNWMTM